MLMRPIGLPFRATSWLSFNGDSANLGAFGAGERAALVGVDADSDVEAEAEVVEGFKLATSSSFPASVIGLETGGQGTSSHSSTEIFPVPPTMPKCFEARSSTWLINDRSAGDV